MQGRCANHVERVAVGTCDRCGSYYCVSCYKQLAGKRICSACLAFPGIDYLADARNKAWYNHLLKCEHRYTFDGLSTPRDIM